MKKLFVVLLMVLCGLTLVGSGVGLLLTDDSLIQPETGDGKTSESPEEENPDDENTDEEIDSDALYFYM